MKGIDLSKQERNSRLMNEFDKFSAKAGESLTSVYERFSTLVNNMDRNKIKPNEIALNTKFLNSLQPKWGKYVTLTRQSHTLSKEHFNKLYDYLSQCEPHVNASRAKQNARNHEPLALVANSNQAVIQEGSVDIQSKNVGYAGNGCRNAGRTTENQATNVGNDKAEVNLDTEENDFMLMNTYGDDQLEELNASVIMMALIQPTDNKFDVELTYDAEIINKKLETIKRTSVDDQIDIDIIFDDPYVEDNSGQVKHDQDAHDQNLLFLNP
ncbi:hypothetical protein Tco_0060611 [Tanacetum coccineum]